MPKTVFDVSTKEVITATENSKITDILTKMEANNIHQIPIVRGSDYYGMVILKQFMRLNYDALKSKIRYSIIFTPSLEKDTRLEDATTALVGSGLKSLPVTEDGKLVGIVSETDLIKHLEAEKDITPENFKRDVMYVEPEDSLGKVIHLMHENNISRVPVVGKQGVLGCIDNLSLIKFISKPKESIRFSEFTAIEKESLKGFKAKDYMRKTFVMNKGDFSLKKAVNALQSHEEIILVHGKKPYGVITPKDVLQLQIVPKEFPIHVSNLWGIGFYDKGKFQELLINFSEKFNKMLDVQRFSVDYDAHRIGGRVKHSLHAKLVTSKKVFISKSHDHSFMKAVHMMLDQLEKQLNRYHGRQMGIQKRGKVIVE